MSYFGNFSTHKVVEMNQSTGLRIGHMVAQTPFVKGVKQLDSLDNGYILALDTAKDELKLAAGNESRLFIHFTEEHMPIMNAGLKYFTVPFIKGAKADGSEDYCYPRAIALYENDTWTTNNFAGDQPEAATVATIDKGQFVIDKAAPATTGHLFIAKPTTLPDGKTDAVQFTYVGYKGV